MPFDVEIQTATGRVRGQLAVPSGPIPLRELVPLACALTDLQVARALVVEERAGRRLSCAAGCGACCRQLVPLSAPEAFHLRAYLDELAPERRAILLERFAAAVRTLDDHDLLETLLEGPSGPQIPLVAAHYFSLQLACPFLENESCSAHPVRPVPCRDYNVTTPPALCADPYNNEVRKVQMPLAPTTALARLTARLVGGRPRLVPLPFLVQWTDEHAELGRRAWPGPELLQGLMAELDPPGRGQG